MCDYSLCGLPTRLAVEGEVLAVHRFQTGSMGLASPSEVKAEKSAQVASCRKGFWKYLRSIFEEPPSRTSVTAVCVPPGTQLVLKNIPPDLRRRWKVAEEELVTFTQLSASPYSYRDAVLFHNGTEVLLQSLREGSAVEVVFVGDMETLAPAESVIPVL